MVEQIVTIYVKHESFGNALMDFLLEVGDVSGASIRPNQEGGRVKIMGPPICCPECNLTYDRELPGWKCSGCGGMWKKVV